MGDEGANGLKDSVASPQKPWQHLQWEAGRKGNGDTPALIQDGAKNELETLMEQLEKLEKQTQYTTDCYWSEGWFGHIVARHGNRWLSTSAGLSGSSTGG